MDKLTQAAIMKWGLVILGGGGLGYGADLSDDYTYGSESLPLLRYRLKRTWCR